MMDRLGRAKRRARRQVSDLSRWAVAVTVVTGVLALPAGLHAAGDAAEKQYPGAPGSPGAYQQQQMQEQGMAISRTQAVMAGRGQPGGGAVSGFAIWLNPIVPWFGNVTISWDWSYLALPLTFEFMVLPVDNGYLWALGAGIGLEVYVGGEAPSGFVFAARAGVDDVETVLDDATGQEVEGSYFVLRLGGTIGYHYVWDSGWALGVDVGAAWAPLAGVGLESTPAASVSLLQWPALPIADAKIGYVF